MAIARGRKDVYDALLRRGASKRKAARIANAGVSHVARSRMSRKGARTRRAKGKR